MTEMLLVDEFFATARERFRIRQRRLAGEPRPWTQDKIFQEWRFCNVFREHDRTTEWFAKNVRSRLAGPDVVRATVIFRWFNRVEVGELIKHELLFPQRWSSRRVRDILADTSPVVTGAYIIKGWDGYSKLDGVLRCIDVANEVIDGWCGTGKIQEWRERRALEAVWMELMILPYMGPFMSYEVVSDLRWTDVLKDAEDVNTWANPGPGCKRGLGWVVHGDSAVRLKHPLDEMRVLLERSRQPIHWPTEWPRWEMREVEHWLCEFDKYQRGKRGDRLKRRYA